MDGVRIPSPMTMMVTRKRTILAVLLFSSFSLVFWVRLSCTDGMSSL